MPKCYFIFFLLVIFSCNSAKEVQQQNEQSETVAHENKGLLILDSLAASEAIVTDAMDHFFKKITVADMSIQLKDNSEQDRDKLLEVYKKELRKAVMNFSDEEKTFVTSVMEEAMKIVNESSAGFKKDVIKLIKVQGKHYGGSAFYTRENCIVIPRATLRMPRESFLQTMFHELFHIYSRYDENTRHELYELIGFKAVGNSTNLLMKDALHKKILLNPDGVNYAYAIELSDKEKNKFLAIPIITSNETGFVPEKKMFFDYLDFNLYRLESNYTLRVLTDDNGNSTLNLQNQPDFFSSIGDNTNYIIHPDEILADNFAFIMMGKRDPAFLNQFSVNGKALMKKIERIIVD